MRDNLVDPREREILDDLPFLDIFQNELPVAVGDSPFLNPGLQGHLVSIPDLAVVEGFVWLWHSHLCALTRNKDLELPWS